MTDTKPTKITTKMIERRSENFAQKNWRAAMAWSYLAVCVFDFIIFPILLGIYSVYTKSTYIPWLPLTLQGGGLYHVAMGAIVGVTSWAKTREKLTPAQKKEE